MNKLLITAFGPFPGVRVNPTEMIARHWVETGLHWSGVPTRILLLPTEYDRADALLQQSIREWKPNSIVMLGVKGNSNTVEIERFAMNLDDSQTSDAAGVAREAVPIEPNGASLLKTSVDVVGLSREMSALGFDVRVSNHAGTYVCNHIYYRSLQASVRNPLLKSVLFVHVPPRKSTIGPGDERTTTDSLGPLLEELIRQVPRTLTTYALHSQRNSRDDFS